MEEATIIAPAKINLNLRIVGIREDGYHELDTLFLPVSSPCDIIRIEPGPDEHFYIRCPENPDLESTSNLMYKAWKAFGAKTGHQPGIFVTLNKSIPMGGGLGGGSSNCAAMLRWLNDTAGEAALTDAEMNALAASLGADVAFFLLDGPAWATGIGEELTPATLDLKGTALLIATPDIHVDTPWAFRAWDEANNFPRVEQSLTTHRSDTKNPSPVSALAIVNDFESIVFERYPTLRKIKEKIVQNGASAAAMSGSGASLFGIFRNRRAAMSAAKSLESDGIRVFTTELA